MQDLFAFSATMAIIVVCLALGAGAIWFFIRATAKSPRCSAHAQLDPNIDLRHLLDDAPNHIVSNRERPMWFSGALVGIALCALFSWMAQRDELAAKSDRVAHRIYRDTRLTEALKALRCPPADAPLEKLLVTVGTQADGKAPQIYCTYVTADLGVIPRIRLGKPQVVAER
jgi:hypothetical protein